VPGGWRDDEETRRIAGAALGPFVPNPPGSGEAGGCAPVARPPPRMSMVQRSAAPTIRAQIGHLTDGT
jgi:hypothetical protein